MAARADKRGGSSKTPWGWIAFGVGLAVCVGVGGAAGVLLGQRDDGNGADAERVAALALDTRGLSEDALGLSRAIEEAIEREELEGEAESLRAELRGLDARAGRIRARAKAEAAAARERDVSSAVDRGLGEISNTVAVFERDVVGRLESVVDDAAAPRLSGREVVVDPAIEEALAEVTATLERQDQTLTALAEGLEESGGEGSGTSDVVDVGAGEVVAGQLETELVASGQRLEIEYGLGELESTAVGVVANGESDVSTSTIGDLTVKNSGEPGSGHMEPPAVALVLYWGEPEATAAIGAAASPSAEEACGYRIEGEPYCALARFEFGVEEASAPGASSGAPLGPGEEAHVDGPLEDDPFSVAGEDAAAAVDFLGSRPPDLVQVLATPVTGSLRPACVPPPDAEALPETTIGLLTGDGEAVFEVSDAGAEGVERDPIEPPACYSRVVESHY